MKNSTHGGRRKGAGRKPAPNRYNQILVKLPPELLARLRQHRKETGEPVNRFIIQAIQEKFEKPPTP